MCLYVSKAEANVFIYIYRSWRIPCLLVVFINKFGIKVRSEMR